MGERLFTYREAAEKCADWLLNASYDRAHADVENVRTVAQVYATLAQAEATAAIVTTTMGEVPSPKLANVRLPDWIAGKS